MATQWIMLAKFVGPIVKELKEEFFKWTAFRPADGEEPDLVNNSLFLVKEEDAKNRMERLAALFESHAHRPPIVYYEKIIDPWTAGPLFLIYMMLRNRNFNLRFATSDVYNYLFIQPTSWENFKNQILHIQQERSLRETELELGLLVSHLLQCGLSWEALLSAQSMERAIIMSSRSVDVGWLDEEVVESKSTLPSWYTWV